jgi:phage recombination protein Bet
MTTDVTVRHAAGEIQEAFLSRQAAELIKATWFKGATDDELQLGIAVANRYRLDPVKKQIYFVKRYDSNLKRDVMQAQVSIDGLRLLAERTGKYAGQVGPQWCGPDGEWREVWLADEPPAAARVGVLRSDWKDALWAVAKFKSYAATTREGNLTAMWAKFPDVMLAKCAESLALRRAFPSETGGIYTEDEMGQADVQVRSIEDAEIVREAPRPSAPKPAAPPTDSPSLRHSYANRYGELYVEATNLGLAPAKVNPQEMTADQIKAAGVALLREIAVAKAAAQDTPTDALFPQG